MRFDDEQLSNETVEIVAGTDHPTGCWNPTSGSEFQKFLRQVPQSSRQAIENETTTVLAHCVPPTDQNGSSTGLVVGYVQSGKTLSFTGVSALARDNGYKLIIVLTGSSVSLYKQSMERLQSDLTLGSQGGCFRDFSSAIDLHTANVRKRSIQSIKSAFDRWDTPGLSSAEKPTVFIMVMKNTNHLKWLNQTLSGLTLNNVPTLIIDDEADQAGLNTQVRRGGQSTTYSLINMMRSALSHHTYLQYTATPQALLLISIIDALSPEFTAVLTPGKSYTGGRTFFEGDLALVKTIPIEQILARSNPLSEPPPTLLDAMRIYFLGVASKIITDADPFNRSMMVHPAQQTVSHQLFHEWVGRTKQRYLKTLDEPATDPDRIFLLSEFFSSYQELARTTDDLPDFARIAKALRRAVAESIITEVNTRENQTPQIRWDRDQFNILIGGQALDRGYTVEGLTVTYMPRDQAISNADNVQQRARWFGYKSGYLGYCRVYLSAHMFQAYKDYVEHEEDVRQQLRSFSRSGRSLHEWKRAFFLSSQFKPTRHNILSNDYERVNYGNQWFKQAAPHQSDEAIARNRILIDRFRKSLFCHTVAGRTSTQTHFVDSTVPLSQLLDKLLTEYDVPSASESLRFYGLLLQVSKYLEDHPDALCSVYIMSRYEERRRRVRADSDNLQNLHQGPDADPRRSDFYPGDEGMRDADALTVQIHNVKVTERSEQPHEIEAVPAIAIWLPRRMSRSVVVQDQRN